MGRVDFMDRAARIEGLLRGVSGDSESLMLGERSTIHGGVIESTSAESEAIRDPRSAITGVVRPIEHKHRDAIEALLRATQSFRENEIKVALEVIDEYFLHPEEDYAALGAFTPGGELLGYVCFGPTPCTVGTWDLYWIAVTPAAQGTGVGTMLLQEVERRLARTDARLVIIETSSLPSYAASRAFYQRRGYEVVARVPDFYATGDDRLIFAKRIHN